MALLEKLRAKEGFTVTEEDLADYVLSNADDVTFLKIRELSDRSHVSASAIVRLCHKLGLEGYRDFRIMLASELERRRSDTRDVNPDQPFFENQSTATIMSSIATVEKAAIDACYRTIPAGDIRTAAKLVLSSRRVVSYALGDSCISCEGFSNLLVKIGVQCGVAAEHGDAMAVSYAMGPADLALVVTYSGKLFHLFEHELDLLRRHQCRMVVITSQKEADRRLLGADCLIRLPAGETAGGGRIASYFSQTCIRYALNSIYGEAYAQNYQANLKRKKDLADLSY